MKIILIITVVLLVLLIIGNLFTYPLQHFFIMQPETLPQDHQYRLNHPFDEVNIPVSHGGNINAIHFKVEHPKGVVLYFHGNAGSLARWGHLHGDFTGRGYDLLIIDYRGYGKSTGPQNQQILYNDAVAVYEWLNQRFEAEDIIIYGRSMGSAMACYAAANVDAKMLILETPFSSMKNLFYTYYKFMPKLFVFKYPFHNDQYLQQVKYPITIFQGTEDWVVPHSNASQLIPLLKESDTFVTIEGATHNDVGQYPLYQQKMDELLQ